MINYINIIIILNIRNLKEVKNMEGKNQIEIIYRKNLDEYQINTNDITIFVKDYNIVLSESINHFGYINLYDKNKSYMGNINFYEINFKVKYHSLIEHIKDRISFNIFVNIDIPKIIN